MGVFVSHSGALPARKSDEGRQGGAFFLKRIARQETTARLNVLLWCANVLSVKGLGKKLGGAFLLVPLCYTITIQRAVGVSKPGFKNH